MPVDEFGQLEISFLHFMPGSHCEDVWRWFEGQNGLFVVGDVQQGKRMLEDVDTNWGNSS
jgi:hypothetical protein